MHILERFESSRFSSDTMIETLQDYFAWQSHRHTEAFIPSADDDVDMRAYLLDLHVKGADQAVLESYVEVLRCFYAWVQSEGVIHRNPFDDYDSSHPFLAGVQIDPRQQSLSDDPNIRELERMRALSQITEQLNGSVDIQSTLDSTLRTLLEVMNLQTGWVSMRTDSPLSIFPPGTSTPHGFVLASAHGLPPGLERENQRFLRQAPACRCQQLLMAGRLTGAVNIVECTRLRDSMQAAGNNQGLLFHASVPLISQGQPVGLINAATTDWQLLTQADLQFLSSVSEQLVVGLERAHVYELSEARRILLENELEVARDVQASLMPRTLPDVPGFDLAGDWRPARQVAGDFYDIFPLSGGRWGIVIGDVAGEGTAAALYMAVVHSLILSGALRHRNPAAVLEEVNRTILVQSSTGIFVSVFLAVIDPKRKTLQYVNAGHNPPVVRRTSGSTELLTRTGAVLGVFEDLSLSETTIELSAGDAVVLYTDGITEAHDPNHEEYGLNRLTKAIGAAPGKAGELLTHLEAAFDAFTQRAPQQDDITLVVIIKE